MIGGAPMKLASMFLISAALVGTALPASAQNVPALRAGRSAQGNRLPAVDLLSPTRVPLDAKEKAAISLAEKWKNNPEKPRKGEDGSVVYLYGATLPTLVCTPLEVCVIRLERGEVVNDVHTGDKARWRITPATSGNGRGQTTHVVVKPTDAGLSTNLFITTDRRSYTIKLASTKSQWIPVLSFDYPDTPEDAWAAYYDANGQGYQSAGSASGEGGRDYSALDFGYRLKGARPSWKPERVYNDGLKTYIQFPSERVLGNDAPALVALGAGNSSELVNYRVQGDRFVVDRVIDRAALISGVGKQETRVVIERTGGK